MSFGRLLRSAQKYLERVKNPMLDSEKQLFDFASPKSLALWTTFSDEEVGGRSTAVLEPSTSYPGTAVLHGTFSRDTSGDVTGRLKRSGWVGMTTRENQGELIDLENCDTLVFRVLGDGRKYLASMRTENWVIGDAGSKDIYQAFLFARKGEWDEVHIPLHRFLLTYKGHLVEQHVEMNPARILSFGLSLAGGDYEAEGPFRLGVDWIKAVNSRSMELPISERNM